MSETEAKKNFTLTDVLLLLMATIWAINFSVVKFGTRSIEPLAFTGLRVGLAAALLIVIALFRSPKWPKWRDTLILLGLGALGNGLYQLFFIEGVSRTRAGNAALIVAAAPAFIAIASRMRGIERASVKIVTGLTLSFVGVGFVVLGSAKSAHGETTLLGSLLVFCGVLCWTAYTVLLQPFTKRMDHIVLSAVAMTGGLIPLIFTTPFSIIRSNWSAVPASAWMALIYSSLVSMVIGYLFWYHGLRTRGPTRTAAYSNLQPMIALAVAWIFLAEIPTPWQIVGVVTIMAGVLLTRL